VVTGPPDYQTTCGSAILPSTDGPANAAEEERDKSRYPGARKLKPSESKDSQSTNRE
jgi:hypothetical protein